MRLKLLVVLGVISGFGTSVVASQPVQWRVDDGGNGHWYARSPEFQSWPAAADAAIARGGHLATPVTQQENEFLTAQGFPYSANGVIYGHWIGGVLSQSTGAWTWISGEPWSFTNFDDPEPNGCCGSDVRFLVFRSHPGHEGRWDDTSTNGHVDATPMPSLIEWSADCNNDGIVDFGQILDGTLLDADANGIPDICEQCTTDLDDNGQLNFFDIAAFVVFFQTQDPRADYNADGLFNFFDFSEYLTAFNAGCP